MQFLVIPAGLENVKSGQGKAGPERGRKRRSPADKEEEVSAKMIKEELTAVQQINMVGLTHYHTKHWSSPQ